MKNPFEDMTLRTILLWNLLFDIIIVLGIVEIVRCVF